MDIIDLRSDTVTHPTQAMRTAMAAADVGDDVYDEDPTVNRLQELAAKKTGKEAGLFVASGTMGNLAAILAHCTRGDEIIVGNRSHTFLHEAGGTAALGGVHSYVLPNQPDGTLKLSDIHEAYREEDVHHPITRLLCLENTQNSCGGVPLSVDYTRSSVTLAHGMGIQVHLDGARIFNAAAALGIPAVELTREVDSVTFCLSKGLCAPVGSVLCGTKEFIQRAKRIRKQLGGGMRQAGVLAAAGIVALNEMVDRLVEDHQNARALAEGLAEIPGVKLTYGMPASNMVFLTLEPSIRLTAEEVARRLLVEKIKVGPNGTNSFRLVTHYWINHLAVEKTIRCFKKVLS